jgi:hypothetical protein
MKIVRIVAMVAAVLLAGVGCGTAGGLTASVSGGGSKRSFAALSCGDSRGLIVRAWGIDYSRIVSLRLLLVISQSGRAWRTVEETGVPVAGDGTWNWSSEPIPARRGAYGMDMEIYNGSADGWVDAVHSSCRR